MHEFEKYSEFNQTFDFSKFVDNSTSNLKYFSFTGGEENSYEAISAALRAICCQLSFSPKLEELDIWGLLNDQNTGHLTPLLKSLPNLEKLTLGGNFFQNRGVQILFTAAANCLTLKKITINHDNNISTSQSAELIARAFSYWEIDLMANENLYESFPELKSHRHPNFFEKYNENHILYKKPKKPVLSYKKLSEIKWPVGYYLCGQRKFNFTHNQTPELALSQLLKPTSKIWVDHNKEPIAKKRLICASSVEMTLLQDLNMFFPRTFFWQGDPNPKHFGKQYSEKFTPATSEEVRKLLAEEIRDDYDIIDEQKWLEILKDNKLDSNPKDLDLSPYGLSLSDNDFKKIIKGISKSAVSIDFQGCHFTPSVISEGISQFTRLETLDLGQTNPWGVDEVKSLVKLTRLKELTLCIRTLEPLFYLSELSNLQRLHLDLTHCSQLTNLNFLSHFGDQVTALNLDHCINLTGFNGLIFCPNLEEISLNYLIFRKPADLIELLSQLKKLRIFSFVGCQYDQAFETLIQKLLPNVICVDNWYNEGRKGSEFHHITNLFSVGSRKYDEKYSLKSHPTIFEEKDDYIPTYERSLASYRDLAERKCAATQVFWDKNGNSPDFRLDVWRVAYRLIINAQGAVVLSSAPFENLQLQILKNISVLKFKDINTRYLRKLPKKLNQQFFAAEVQLILSDKHWTRLPTRGVLSKLIACSENFLIFASSQITRELFVRLKPGSISPQKIQLRYIIAAVLRTQKLDTDTEQKLPELVAEVMEKLNKNTALLAAFPKYQGFLEDISKKKGQQRLSAIIKYCQMSSSGFTDQPLDPIKSKIVNQFVDELFLENRHTVASLKSLLDPLLQQRGTCQVLAQTAKLFGDLYRFPCHILESKVHNWVKFSLYHEGEYTTEAIDLGGGEVAELKYTPLSHIEKMASEESKLPAYAQSESLENKLKKRYIDQILSRFKPINPLGFGCIGDSYWQLLFAQKNPLVYLDQAEDADKFLAALSQYIKKIQYCSSERLFYLAEQDLTVWLDAIKIETNDIDSEITPVPGWLQRFLQETTPGIIVINFFDWPEEALVAMQAAFDLHATINHFPISSHIQVIAIATKQLAKQDSFSSRLTPFFPPALEEVKPMQCITPLSSDIKRAPKTPLYHDAYYADSVLLGMPALEGQLTFIPGVLSQASKQKQSLTLVDVPQKIIPILKQIYWSRQFMSNGELQPLAQETILYQDSHCQPHTDKIHLITEIKTDKTLFILNSYSFPWLVKGRRRIDPSSGNSYSCPPILSQKDPLVIVVTESLTHSEGIWLMDAVESGSQHVSLSLCQGVCIVGTGYAAPSIALPKQSFKLLKESCVIESDNPEATLAMLQKEYAIPNQNIISLTPEIQSELLMLISRRGNSYQLNYRQGWLLSQLHKHKITVLIGPMSALLYRALESLFCSQSHLYTNEGRETFKNKVVWIKPSDDPLELASAVIQYQHQPELKKTFPHEQKQEQKTDSPPLSYRQRYEQVGEFILEAPDNQFLQLIGPPGSGKTDSVCRAIRAIKGFGKSIQRFSAVKQYVAWLQKNPQFVDTLCVLHLDDAKMLPPGQLEWLRDIIRCKEFFYRGYWYPCPKLKIIVTNNPEVDPHHEKHPFFADFPINTLYCPPLTPAEMDEYLIKPELPEIKADLIIAAYRYIETQLPKACISAREITDVCQRLKILQTHRTTETTAVLLARACYEEFFGLFDHDTQRREFWQFLTKSAKLTAEESKTPIPIDLGLMLQLQQQGIQLTDQISQTAMMLQRFLQMQSLNHPHFSGKCGLLLEGPPGILKTELCIAVLQSQGYQEYDASGDSKTPKGLCYVNLIAHDAQNMERLLLKAAEKKWLVLCNEFNLLEESTIKLLLYLLESGKIRLIVTQNKSELGGGRKPLPRSLKNRFHEISLRDYHRDELIDFAFNKNFKEKSRLIADMFMALKTYQSPKNLAVANARHYFKFLKELSADNTPEVILQTLLKTGCNPLLIPQEQLEAANFILEQLPFESFPNESKPIKGGVFTPTKIPLTTGVMTSSSLDLS